ncbi:MAG: WD40 repeat domain-containing protein [Verrucomicrobiales bacterium]
MNLWIFLCTAAMATTAGAALPIADLSRETPIDFGKEVYPVLRRNCLACHNTTKAKAGLILESPEAILRGGDNGPAAVAGRSGESLILKTAAHLEDPAMPPAGNKVNAVDLTADELGLLKLWIDQGARASQTLATELPIVWRGFPTNAVPVSAAAVSPAGRFAAAARGNQVELVEVGTGVSHGFLSDPALADLEMYRGRAVADRDAVMSLAFASEDLLATGGYRTVRLWRRAAFRSERESQPLPEPALSLAAAGTVVAAGDAAGRVWLWDSAGEKPDLIELKDHAAPVKAVAFTPDAAFLVSAAEDRSVRVWSVPDRRVVFRSESPVPVASLAFLQTGTLLAASGADGVLRVYRFSPQAPPDQPIPEREIRLADKAPAVLTALDPTGPLLLWGNGDAILHVLDVATGQTVRQVACEHPGQPAIARADRQLQAAQRHADGRQTRATAAAETAKKESDAARTAHESMEKTRFEWQRKLAAATAAAESARSQPDDKGRQETADKSLRDAQSAERDFLNARTNAELGVRLAGQALHAQIAADAALAAARAALAETQAALEAAKKLPPFPAIKSALVLSDTRSVVIAVEGGRIQWHSLETGAIVDSAELASPLLAATTTDRLVSVAADKKGAVYSARRPWQHVRTIGTPEDPSVFGDRVTALDFSSDARVLATGGGIPSRGGEVKLWHTHDGSLALALKNPHSDTVNALAFSPDDSLLATAASDRWARVFRVADGQPVAAFEGHSAHVLSVAWRADGLALATGGADKSLRTWDALEARQLGNNTSFGKEVSAVSWVGASDVVASASGDTTVRLNDERLPKAAGFAFCLATDSLGSLVAAGGQDGILRVWRAPDKSLLREIRPPVDLSR